MFYRPSASFTQVVKGLLVERLRNVKCQCFTSRAPSCQCFGGRAPSILQYVLLAERLHYVKCQCSTDRARPSCQMSMLDWPSAFITSNVIVLWAERVHYVKCQMCYWPSAFIMFHLSEIARHQI